MGRIGDALKHWVISQTLTKGINLANDYLMSAQQNPKILDKYNDSIKFYNLGLNYINQNNDDMGVIQLKKSGNKSRLYRCVKLISIMLYLSRRKR